MTMRRQNLSECPYPVRAGRRRALRRAVDTAVCCFASLLIAASAAALDEWYQREVQSLIELFKEHDREGIASRIIFPLRRRYPIPAISDKGEMLRRFDEVFDAELSERIAASTPDDWSPVGSKGIMLNNGIVWIDTNGLIIAINHQSKAEEQLRQRLVAAEKAQLHESLREFDSPVLKMRTLHYRIRIDDLGDGHYRYAAWPSDRDSSEKPEIVLTGGEVTYEGSGGNHYYTFTNGCYRYLFYVNAIGTSTTPPGSLEVYRGDALLLEEPVIEVLSNYWLFGLSCG